MTRHRLDLFSLVSGLVLIAIAVAAMTGVWFRSTLAVWVWPATLLAAGVIVLVAILASVRTRPSEDDLTAPAADVDAPLPHHDPVMAAARQEVEDADHTSEERAD